MKTFRFLTKHLPLATVAIMMVACANEDYVGDKELQRQNENGKPISLSLVAAPQTRSAEVGAVAAGYLNNNFVIYGRKSFTDPTTSQVVFNNYQANYVTNTAGTTTSNASGWEYVGYKNLPYGTKTTSAGTLNDEGVAANALASGVDQSIKYWDYSAAKYEFMGYSLGGTSSTTSWATSTPITYNVVDDGDDTTPPVISYSYELKGTDEQLSNCYVSDMLTKVDMNATNTSVQLQFRRMSSNVRIALYENIPGYSVKDVMFYSSEGGTPSTTAYLYDNSALTGSTSNASIPSSGKYTVTYTPLSPTPGTSQQTPATITWTPATTAGSTSNVSFGVANPGNGSNEWTDWAATTTERVVNNSGELTSLGTVFLGKTSSESTMSPWVSVLPNPNGTELHLKVDYTLVSLDGYGETINVTGATATVPAAYAQWQPNCSYTYIFKITDAALYPITLDAVVNINADGKQETITTVSEPSITTYSSTSDVITNNEYIANETVYAVVEDGGSLATLSASNMKLYTVTTTDADNFPITESSVADALLKQTTLTAAQATAAKIKCTDATSSLDYGNLAGTIEMHATNDVVAYFTVEADNVYVLQYIKTPAVYTYDGGKTYADTDAFAAAGTLYTKSGDVYTEATTWTDGTTMYYKRTGVNNEGAYAYKVINVKESETP